MHVHYSQGANTMSQLYVHEACCLRHKVNIMRRRGPELRQSWVLVRLVHTQIVYHLLGLALVA